MKITSIFVLCTALLYSQSFCNENVFVTFGKPNVFTFQGLALPVHDVKKLGSRINKFYSLVPLYEDDIGKGVDGEGSEMRLYFFKKQNHPYPYFTELKVRNYAEYDYKLLVSGAYQSKIENFDAVVVTFNKVYVDKSIEDYNDGSSTSKMEYCYRGSFVDIWIKVENNWLWYPLEEGFQL